MIVYLLTDVGGRVSYMVQGVRSHRGSKLALFQPMFPVEFEGLLSSKQQMHRFKEVRGGFTLRNLPFDVRKSTVALFMAETLYKLVRESEANPELFEFVWKSVEALDAMEEGVADFHLWFMAKLSRFLGFCPGNEYREGMWFDLKEGLYVEEKPSHPGVMSRQDSSLLNQLLEGEASVVGHLGLNRERRVGFLNVMLIYFGYHLDAIGSVQSVRILQEVF